MLGSAADVAMELAAGAVIAGRYRLDRVLGEGGMGVVWAARDRESDEPVALKLVKAPPEDEGARRRLVREARAAAAVKHPHVVAVREVVELDGSPVIVMELLTGEPLSDLLKRRGRLSAAETATLLAPVVSAVGAAHAMGLIHRDLKPANIWLGEPCSAPLVKVLDFGIAKLVATEDAGGGGTTTTGVVVGTPAYMSPEQLFGERDMDHRVDVWSLGLIAYQCLSGTLPTSGESVGQILKGVLARPIPRLAEAAPGVPADLAAIIDRMLSRDREQRPATLAEVHAVLLRHTDARPPDFGEPAWDVAGSASLEPASPPIAPPPPITAPSRWKRRAMLLGAGLAASLAVVAWTRRPLENKPPAAIAASPLTAPSAALACPPLAVSGGAEASGWLGAAAASMLCDRARVLLGGRPERIRVPAELLDLPRDPVDSFPADPFADPAARDRAIAAARARAGAYLDGGIAREGARFRLAITLRASDGRALGEAKSEAPALPDAVREVTDALAASGQIPRAQALDPAIAAWSRAGDVEAALALLDVQLHMAANGGGLAKACDRLASMGDRVAEMGPGERWRCAYTRGSKTPDLVAPALGDEPPPALAGRARVSLMLNGRGDHRAVAARLHEAFAREEGGWGRAMLASTESCLLQSSDPERARELALLAVKAEPRCPDGQLCAPWGQLLNATSETRSAASAMRAMQAWSPWDSNGWSAEAAAVTDPARALAYARRAYLLSPFDANAADALADRLLASGAREEARGVALALSAGGFPVHRVESDILLVRIDASEARFGAALSRARRALESAPEEGGYVRVQRIDVAYRALEIAALLGRAAEIADLVSARFVEPDPSPLDWIYTSVPLRAAAFCAHASRPVSERCFARLASAAFQSNTPGVAAFIAGARRYAAGDRRGAARAWRPLMSAPGVLTSILPEAMSEAFEASGDVELGEKLDAAELAAAARWNGASPAHARAAKRAFTRGDLEAARALAKRVVEAWSTADEPVPAVAEMRKILSGSR